VIRKRIEKESTTVQHSCDLQATAPLFILQFRRRFPQLRCWCFDFLLSSFQVQLFLKKSEGRRSFDGRKLTAINEEFSEHKSSSNILFSSLYDYQRKFLFYPGELHKQAAPQLKEYFRERGTGPWVIDGAFLCWGTCRKHCASLRCYHILYLAWEERSGRESFKDFEHVAPCDFRSGRGICNLLFHQGEAVGSGLRDMSFLNAFEIGNFSDLGWGVKTYTVEKMGGGSGGHESRGEKRSIMWDLRKKHSSRCPGYGFIIDVDESSMAVPARWHLPEDILYEGYHIHLDRACEVRSTVSRDRTSRPKK